MTIMIEDASYLSASVVVPEGTTKGKMVMTVRLQEDSYVSHNLAFTPEQAVRMWRDINLLMAGSQILKNAIVANPDDYVGFAETMSVCGFDQYTNALTAIKAANPKPKTPRKRKP